MRNINTPDFSNINEQVVSQFDFSDKTPDLEKREAMLTNLMWSTENTVHQKEVFYKEDAEFKYEVWKCMATFEHFQGRDLTMCTAYFDDSLLWARV